MKIHKARKLTIKFIPSFKMRQLYELLKSKWKHLLSKQNLAM